MGVSPVVWCIGESMRPGASLLPKARHPWQTHMCMPHAISPAF